MSRVQVALNVSNVDQAVAFYSTVFNTEPAQRRPGYASFAITDPPLKLVLLSRPRRCPGVGAESRPAADRACSVLLQASHISLTSMGGD